MFTSTSLHTTTNAAAAIAADAPKSLGRDSPKPAECSMEASAESLMSTSNWKIHRINRKTKPYRERGERVRINVSGRMFESYKSTLVSKDGSIFALKSISNYYDKKKSEYFFDRDPRNFEAILVYLQCGLLVQPEKVAFRSFIEDLQFFGFSRKAAKIYREELVKAPSKGNYSTLSEVGLKKYIFNLLEYPDVNFFSRFLAAFSTFVIFLSICVYCVESLPNMSETDMRSLYIIETICVIWFTVELTMRFILCPSKWEFIKSVMNLIDLVSIVPFYVALIDVASTNVVGIAMLRVLRVARVFRVFKLSRYSKAIYLIILTIKSSVREFLLLVMFVVIMMILFAAGIYHFENDFEDKENKFKSIPHTFWLVIVTITTVGYGDMYPITPEGRFITSILTVTGVVIVALPIPIIVNNFTKFYEQIMSQTQKYQFDYDESKCIHKHEDKLKSATTTMEYETSL